MKKAPTGAFFRSPATALFGREITLHEGVEFSVKHPADSVLASAVAFIGKTRVIGGKLISTRKRSEVSKNPGSLQGFFRSGSTLLTKLIFQESQYLIVEIDPTLEFSVAVPLVFFQHVSFDRIVGAFEFLLHP